MRSVQAGVASMFVEVSVNVPRHLKSIPGVTDVTFRGGDGASIGRIQQWEEVRRGRRSLTGYVC